MTVGHRALSSHVARLIEQKDMAMMIVLESSVMATTILFSVAIVTASAACFDSAARQKERSNREGSRERCQ
jgi:hypothetical protein